MKSMGNDFWRVLEKRTEDSMKAMLVPSRGTDKKITERY